MVLILQLDDLLDIDTLLDMFMTFVAVIYVLVYSRCIGILSDNALLPNDIINCASHTITHTSFTHSPLIHILNAHNVHQ